MSFQRLAASMTFLQKGNTTQTRAMRPLNQRSSGRLVLLAAWLAFWLNTALFPCCEVLAAALVGHSEVLSQATIDGRGPHPSHEAYAEHLHEGKSLPCAENGRLASAIAGAYAQLPEEPSLLQWFAIESSASADLRKLARASIASPLNYHSPPPVRVYRQTQRLLI